MKRAWILTPAGADGERRGRGRCGALRGRRQAVRGLLPGGCRQAMPLVVLVHDWDGLNGYEIKRPRCWWPWAAVFFAVDLFGAGVRPGTVEDKKRLTGPFIRTGPGCAPCCKGIGGGGQAGAARQMRWPSVTAWRRCRAGAWPAAGRISKGGERTRRAGDPGRAGSMRRSGQFVQHGSADEVVSQ